MSSINPVESIVPGRNSASAASTFEPPRGAAPVKSPTRVRTLTRLCALAAVLALAVVPAAAQDVTTQFWPEIDTFIRLNENFRI